MARDNHAGDAMARAKAAIARMEIVIINPGGEGWRRIASLLRLAADAADAAAKGATED
jgi:hypothetical protein